MMVVITIQTSATCDHLPSSTSSWWRFRSLICNSWCSACVLLRVWEFTIVASGGNGWSFCIITRLSTHFNWCIVPFLGHNSQQLSDPVQQHYRTVFLQVKLSLIVYPLCSVPGKPCASDCGLLVGSSFSSFCIRPSDVVQFCDRYWCWNKVDLPPTSLLKSSSWPSTQRFLKLGI